MRTQTIGCSFLPLLTKPAWDVPTCVATQDNFLDGTSSTYLEELEERYLSDPSSVDKTWASFFHNLGGSSN